MSFLDAILRGLTWLCCGPKAPEVLPDGASQDLYVPPTVSHRHSQRHRPEPSTPPSYRSRNDAPFVTQPQHERPAEHRPEHRSDHGTHHAHSPSPGRIDPNQVNQSNPHYTALRARANEEGDAMAQAFEGGHQAYERGDGALAKELSNKGKRHQAEMDRLNKEAAEWIFIKNNEDSKPGEVDLHGLYVKEAITYTDRAIQQARARGDSEVHLIVGKGLHSKNGAAKIKPAIEDLMQKHQLVAELDPQNTGVLIVSLDGRDRDTGNIVKPDDIARGIQRQDGGCVIM
ncbi:uncharacterized protein PHACADRAFT_257781 [Phanerochaete carnosa HHB-10118-sp]|uniref:Smr domain-containing protein n=1 Tax=Phanerochaete carnosa (strain HHB-10118-sp) TaxID=650164 RepID=K5W5B6_PHACS|nr:uncharacterized protein PHACADRAFT_257781 [Phanerochaete carnosa HHB-10118-sp]EKM54149.1 hypothetical protein PHACADRAFT_257781 [Phanerochaete carnosa HHB-10118-sp]